MISTIKTAPCTFRRAVRTYLSNAGIVVSLILLLTYSSQAQEAGPQRGFKPGSSFALSDIESINMTNGNMMMNFPLGPLPAGRNGLTAAISLIYNNKYYNSRTSWVEDAGRFNCGLQPCYFQKTELGFTNEGGWRYGLGYTWEVIERASEGALHPNAQCTIDDAYLEMTYRYKVRLIFPDGSSHEMRPNGFSDHNGNDPAGDYFNVTPDGWISDCMGNGHWHSNPTMFYYSIDGTFLKLEVPRSGGWTLYFPDGTRVVSPLNEPQRIYDRNNNYVEIDWVENYQNTGQPAIVLVDQLDRSATITYDTVTGEDLIHVQGFGQELVWRVHWNTIQVWKTYWPCAEGTLNCQTGDTGTSQYQTPQPFSAGFFVVDRITLPQQAGNLSYTFSYNAPFQPQGWPPPTSLGWGELSGVTLPTGAQASYQFALDTGPEAPHTADILRNSPTRKDLTYAQEYDGTTNQVTDTWLYGFGSGGGSVTGPDGGTSSQASVYAMNCWFWNCGLTYVLIQPDGTKIERLWAKNNLANYGTINSARGDNPYVKTEFISIKNAAGAYVKTSIKDYKYDKNGNVTRVAEYDWLDYASIPRDSQGNPTGIPSGVLPASVTTNTYFAPTPDASQEVTNGNVYWFQSAPLWKNGIASSEISDGTGAIFSRTEFAYDNPFTTGNLTQQTSWDSTKGPYSNPLMPGNSISVSNQYTAWSNGNTGKLIQTTDARGFSTVLSYGSVGGFDIYPTQTQTAFGTSVQRTETREYDFNTGLITRVTDADNNVSTVTTYDAFGRPILVRAAEGKPEESRTTTEYSDTLRRVIVRADLNTLGDGKLVTIEHYDQLGRVRLARQLEDSTTQSATDENTGIKVQTRYLYNGANSYVLTSNAYRAATSTVAGSEATMGWTRSKSDNAARIIEVQTFAGPTLPFPWGSNTISTGTVLTAYDAQFTTVNDQTGRIRRSVNDGLGRLARVDEPNTYGNLGEIDAPFQATSYAYDALGNLTNVYQGEQTRTFVYSSLSRLVSATNPESGTVSYGYDGNGNLTSKTDARSITTTSIYDPLNRVTSRTYSDSTPGVTYNYDPAIGNGKGRLSSVSSSVSTYSYSEYDAFGRVKAARQTLGSQSYLMSYSYDLAGHVKTMNYPSGRVVNYTFDGAGRTNSFTGTLGGAARNYSTAISYSAFGGLSQEQFGTSTPIYNKLFYNSRGQLAEIREGMTPYDTSWQRGAIINHYSDTCWGMCYDTSTNTFSAMADYNGNVKKQEHWIQDANGNVAAILTQKYAYDTLNRLQRVYDGDPNSPVWQQRYEYDRYGNRTINTGATWGTGVNNTAFELDPANTNRLLAPGDPSLAENVRRMQYDQAGNLKTDTYTGQGARTYDAENRMTTSAGVSAGTYIYDADGRRVKRIVGTSETWQIYGIGGEMLAEYAANGNPASPQKEYGYRNGQLLITATVGGPGWGSAPTFQDNPLMVGATEVRSIHITELRSAIDAVRSHLGLSAYNWQAPAGAGDWITIAPIQEMRTALDQALEAGNYAGGLAQGQPILKVHVQELRDRVLAAWQSGGGIDIRWLVSDQIGTPRMIFDQSGSVTVTDQNGNYVSGMTRHDYLPFGEELTTLGGRSPLLGYVGDSVRQKFTSKERDIETGLDYFGSRYHASTQGRFTGPDVPLRDQQAELPQSWNLYLYVRNNPLRYFDDDGHDVKDIRLKTSGPNEGKKKKSQEAGNVEQLGPKVQVGNFTYAVNIIVEFTPDDNPENYNPVQTAFVIYPRGQNTDVHRPGQSDTLMPDNPEKDNVTRTSSQLIWQDNPGLATSGAPPASINGTYLAFFTSTVKPKDEKKGQGKSTDKVLYWAVRIDVKNGKIVNSAAAQVTPEDYYKATGQTPPKKKEKEKEKAQ